MLCCDKVRGETPTQSCNMARYTRAMVLALDAQLQGKGKVKALKVFVGEWCFQSCFWLVVSG